MNSESGYSQAYFNVYSEFAGKEHNISFIRSRKNVLKIEVRNTETFEEWHANFSSEYIEEITKKTGNFKTFDVFISMLYSVSKRKSNSLILDIVSYDDLDSLRRAHTITSKSTFSLNDNSSQSRRRFLILTYIADFDRTFYPLPLVYTGIPDRKKVLTQLHNLREEVYNKQINASDQNLLSKFVELQKRLEVLQKEKDNADSQLSKLKSVLEVLNADCLPNSDVSMSTEVELGDSFKPKSKLSKGFRLNSSITPIKVHEARLYSDQENNNLRKRLNLVINKEKLLQIQVQKLRQELNSFKKMRNNFNHNYENSTSHRSNSLSSNSLRGKSKSSFISMRSAKQPIYNVNHNFRRTLNKNIEQRRAQSADSIFKVYNCRGVFDPTAYVREKQRKLKENQNRKLLQQKLRMKNCTSSLRKHSHSPYSNDSRCTSLKSTDSCSVSRRKCSLSPVLIHLTPPLTCKPVKKRTANLNKSPLHSDCDSDSSRILPCLIAPPSHRLCRRRSPCSKQLLNSVGAFTDSESERYPSKHLLKPNCRNTNGLFLGKKMTKHSSRINSPFCSMSESESVKSNPCQANRRYRKLSKVNNIKTRPTTNVRNSEKMKIKLDDELTEMDHRLEVLQTFFKNYFTGTDAS